MTFDLTSSAVLFQPDVLEDPRPFHEHLRRHAPVWQLPGQHTYLVSDPALVRDVVGRSDEFSSNLVSMIRRGADGQATGFEILPFGDPSHVLAVADEPHHSRHRRILQTHLSPAAVAPLEPEVRALTAARLSTMVAAGGGDAVAGLADVVPAEMLCRLLGRPTGDAADLVANVVALGAMLDGVTDDAGMERSGRAVLEIYADANDHLAEHRRRDPADRAPLTQAIIEAIDDGELTEDEAHGILIQLLTAGTETTQSLIATTVRRLAGDPGLQARLRADPTLIPDELEHILRVDGPFQFHYRWTTTDAELGTTTIPAASRVLLMWSAANHQLPEDPTRDRLPPHFAFGRGIHFCIGASLARLESKVVIEELLARTTSIELDPDRPAQRRPSIMLRRHDRLPIIVR